MSNDDDSVYNALLAAAAVPFYRDIARLAINFVLRDALHSNANKELNPQSYFRPDIITDATLTPPAKVPNSAQRLVRWDRRAPLHIFTHGFRPNAPPHPTSRKDAVTDVAFANILHEEGAFNLEGYVVHDERNSVFVSTTEPYVDRAGNDPMVWCPDFRGPEDVYFMYEIFAYGGFYVGRVLANNPHAREREIAFIGGIRPELIRLAYEYRGDNLVRVHRNSHFNPTLNPDGHRPALADLPCPRIPDNLKVFDPDLDFRQTATAAPEDPEGLRRFVSEDEELMRMQGNGVKDPLYSLMHPHRTSVMALTSTSDPSRIWFFCANRVLKMNYYYFGLCSSSENICDSEDWKTLKIAGFKGGVDAILIPQGSSDHEYTAMYAFSGDKYASINPNGGSCVSFSLNCTSNEDIP